MPEDIFSGADKAKEKLDFIGPGKYRLKVREIVASETFEDKRPCLWVYVDVVSATPESANQKGGAAILIKKDKYKVERSGEVLRSLGAAILNEPFEKVNESTLRELSAEDQPARGNEFLAEVRLETAKKSGKKFPAYRFAPVE